MTEKTDYTDFTEGTWMVQVKVPYRRRTNKGTMTGHRWRTTVIKEASRINIRKMKKVTYMEKKRHLANNYGGGMADLLFRWPNGVTRRVHRV